MAWNIGANDVANAMGTSVGSGALTLKRAVLIAAFLEFAGAVLVGSNVARTQRTEIVDPTLFNQNPELLMYGMVAALLSSALWITLATYYSMPVSTTHSIVGSIIGFGIAAYGFSAIQIAGVSKIMLSWLISPLAGAVIAYLIFIIVRKKILLAQYPLQVTKKIVPPIVGLVFFTITMSAIYKGLKNLNFDMDLLTASIYATIVGSISVIISFALLNRVNMDDKDQYGRVEKIFAYLQIISACYVAFAHGANDVGNAVAPLATIMEIGRQLPGDDPVIIGDMVDVPIWILILGGLGITVGVMTWGKKVIQTIGSKITDLTPTRGFSAEFGTATTVLICSKLGMPISTTHTLVGGVIGVGMAGGVGALDMRVIWKIILSWVITLPIAASTTIAILWVIRIIVGI
jgi:PiT family inorganic phosphate transporter